MDMRSGAIRSRPASCSSASSTATDGYALTNCGWKRLSSSTSRGSGSVTGSESTRCRPPAAVCATRRLMCAGEAATRAATRSRRGSRGSDAGQRVVAQELGEDRGPPRAVVDEQALAARRPAGRHHPVAAEEQGVARERLDVGEQRVAAQARVGHHGVEAVHHRRLVEHGQPAQVDRAGERAEALAIERRVRDRVAHERVEALLLQDREPLARQALMRAELARPPRPRGEVSQPLALVGEAHQRLLPARRALARRRRGTGDPCGARAARPRARGGSGARATARAAWRRAPR